MNYKKQFKSYNVSEFEDYPFDHPPFTKGFLDSILEYGIIEPPVVGLFTENRKRSIKILSGQRRIHAHMYWAEKDEDFPQIFDAIVIMQAHKVPYNELIVITNTHDNPNPFSDLKAIKDLVSGGSSLTEIAKSIFKSVTYIRQIMKLDILPPEILKAGEEGTIAQGTLRKLASKQDSQIKTALKVFKEKGKLTLDDVTNISKTHNQNLVSELFTASDFDFEQDMSDDTTDEKPYVIVNDGKIVTGIIKGYDDALGAKTATGNGAMVYALVPVA